MIEHKLEPKNIEDIINYPVQLISIIIPSWIGCVSQNLIKGYNVL